jgi:hypothetical protein
MSKLIFLTAATVIVTLGLTRSTLAYTPANTYAGYFVYQASAPTTFWYIDPTNHRRYFLAGAEEAYRTLVLRVVNIDGIGELPEDIPTVEAGGTGILATRQHYAGRIVSSWTDNTTMYWYVYPNDLYRHRITAGNLFSTIAPLTRLITETDLKSIPVGYAPPPKAGSSGLTQKSTAVVTKRGTFQIDYVMYDYRAGTYKIMTDTGDNKDCARDCTVLPLGTYAKRRGAIAGIHGSYFCPRDYPQCASKIGFYYYPVYNSFTQVMINSKRIKYTAEPMVMIDTAGRPYMITTLQSVYHNFADLNDYMSMFAPKVGGSGILQAAISNGPWLVRNSVARRSYSGLDTKQATVKTMRGVLAWQGAQVYLMIVKRATVPDAGAVVASMGMDNAINLDGGGSAALYYKGKYIDGPGRNLPNSILIVKK